MFFLVSALGTALPRNITEFVIFRILGGVGVGAASLVSQTFPMLNENPWLVEVFNHSFPFWVYGSLCVVTVVFVQRLIPETRGKPLEEIEKLWHLEP